MSDIDISQLPAPDVVETIDYEQILAERQASLLSLVPESLRASVEATLQYESEPLTIVLQESAYREMTLRQRINEAAVANMLAYARGADLDQLAVFYGVERQTIRQAQPDSQPPEPALYESDADFLRRIRLSLRGLSVAGPADSYVFEALSASSAVRDASAESPRFEFVEWVSDTDIRMRVIDDVGLDRPLPGDVAVSVLARESNGTPDTALISDVQAAVAADDVRPMTDNPRARAAEVVEYTIDATLYFRAGPDAGVVIDEANAAAERYVIDNHALGRDIEPSAIYAALHQPGVQRVELRSPAARIPISARQAPYCTDINLTDGGIHV